MKVNFSYLLCDINSVAPFPILTNRFGEKNQ